MSPLDVPAAEGGYGNYVPGTYGDFALAVAPVGKLTLRNDVYFYNAEVERAVRAGRVDAAADLEFLSNLTTLIYSPGVELFGAQYAFGALIPWMQVDYESRASSVDTTVRSGADASGLGDIAWIPAALFWNRGNLHYSLSEVIVSPTGKYDVDAPINVGLNYWSFDTNLAVTYLDLDTGKDLSLNLGYIYNTENEDTDYQSGQEIHIDVALNQFLSDTLALGLHGFHVNQVSGDSGAGALLGDFKAEATGFGPAVYWATRAGQQDVSIIVKWLHEVDAENRIEGDHMFLSVAMDW